MFICFNFCTHAFRIIGVHIVCLLCEFVYFIILRIQTL